jgi:hypothetical protein
MICNTQVSLLVTSVIAVSNRIKAKLTPGEDKHSSILSIRNGAHGLFWKDVE